jgi:hypothetical protein
LGGQSATPKKDQRQRQLFLKEIPMTYTKPEVAALGKAVLVIEHTLIKFLWGTVVDPSLPTRRFLPAYDLDE